MALIQNILVEHASELAELAAACGIDWYQISDLSHGRHQNLPTTEKKYKGKCTMWVDERTSAAGTSFIRITFHTRKHGGVTRTWHSHATSLKLPSLPKRSVNTDEAERQRRKSLFVSYREAFFAAPQAITFPYLERKGIASILNHMDIRVMTDAKVLGKSGQVKPFICFALQSPGGHYVGLQRIYMDGSKKLTAGFIDGQYKGAHAFVGNPDESRTIYIAEGFATAASIYLATGSAVAFAYSADNLDLVTAHVKSRFEDKEIIIAADNDVSENGNTGLFKAWEAARHNRGKRGCLQIAVPPAPAQEKVDFNDIHVKFGVEALREVLENPANVRKPSSALEDYLFELLQHARKQEIPAIVRKLAVATKVPHFLSAEQLADRVVLATGPRAERSVIMKNIKAVIVASLYKAKKLAAISDKNVETRLRFLTQRNPHGHLVIGPDAAAAVQEELGKGQIVIVKAPMGTGKTEIIIRQAMANAFRAAHVLPRVSVVDDAASRLQLDHYRNVDGIMAHFTDKMVTCVNSLGASRFIANGRNWFEGLDLLCLDEASQIFPQVTQLGKAERRKTNHDALAVALRTAGSVLIADADANEYLVNALRRIVPERKITLVEIEHQEDERRRWRVHVNDSISETRGELVRSVLTGERCILATDNRRKAVETERLLRLMKPDVRILNIHREPSRENLEKIKRFYANPNKECLEYDVLIYSPAITSGVSLTIHHFTRHFGIFTGVVKVNDLIQMLGRDRTAGAWLLTLAPRTWNQEKLSADVGCETMGQEKTLFSELKFSTEAYEHEARDNLVVLAISILKLKGHLITVEQGLKKRTYRKMSKLLKTISEDLTRERLQRILEQADISEAEYLDFKARWMPTEEEAAAIHAYRIRHHLCADLTEENVRFMDDGGLKKVVLLETLRTDDRDIQQFDANQKVTHDPSLRFYAAEKKCMLLEALGLLRVDMQDFGGEFTHADCQRVVAYFLEKAPKANFLFRGIIDPARPPRCATTFVQKIVRMLGLTLGSRKSNGRMIRFIDPASIETMLSHLNRRRDRNQTHFSDPLNLPSTAA